MKKIFVLALVVCLLSSCTQIEKYEKTLFSMDTQIEMTAYGKTAEAALKKAAEEIKRIDKKFGILNISDTIGVSDEETKEILSLAYEIGKKTNGAFDINIAPVMRVWGFYSKEFADKEYRVPGNEEIDVALAKMREGREIDLGAIAKGYCTDRVVTILKDEGVTSAVLSLGGNVAVIGKNPDGKPWKIGIQNPFGSGVYATILAEDTSVVTSGDYVRFFERDGKKYHHIIDTKTGYPADSGLSSVTVMCKKSAYADALSTAFFVMGKDKAVEYWKKDKSFQMILIDKSGKIYYTDGLNISTDYDKEQIK